MKNSENELAFIKIDNEFYKIVVQDAVALIGDDLKKVQIITAASEPSEIQIFENARLG